jgi:nitroimidazol reductase NimA-like FMN-containing flavoprotein (pyridoxamine 5'-phosphate oxidase superfamily)
MHSARAGRTASNVEGDEAICFTVTEMGRLLPAPRAFNMSVEYNGVVVFGRARIIDGEPGKRAALDLLVRKYFPHLNPESDYALPDQNELNLTAVYRIQIDEWSGKRKKVEDEYPNAFLHGDHGRAPWLE